MIEASRSTLEDPAVKDSDGAESSCHEDGGVDNQSKDTRSPFPINPTRKLPRISPVCYQAQVVDSAVATQDDTGTY